VKRMRTLWPLILALGLLTPIARGQEAADSPSTGITGNWLGSLDTGAFKLRLLVKIAGQPAALTGTMDSLDQGATGIVISTLTLTGDTVHFEVPSIHGSYDGKRSTDGTKIVGTWTQGAGSLPLTLTKTDTPPAPRRRPQEPKPPFPYVVKDVTFPDTQGGVTLAGTLTQPLGTGPFPAVVLIAGSGPNGRDEEIFGHKPFLVLADYLTRRGIAVLRYDKRGIGQSTGSYALATSIDFTDDALAAVRYLKTLPQVRARQIGLIGHSEGGLIAPLAATRSQDVAFIVLMAGPGLTGEQILLRQSALIARGSGAPEAAITQQEALATRMYAVLKTDGSADVVRQKVQAIVTEATAALPPEARAAAAKQTDAQITTILSPWFRFFITYDPVPTLKRVHCPVLALNGSHDLQVPPKEDLAAIRDALKAGGNADYTVQELPDLNHLFQTCQTGLPSEYATIEETISPATLQGIAGWIGKHTSAKSETP
jgi:pimeloyl-ACP methyl ester carboxylesterase